MSGSIYEPLKPVQAGDIIDLGAHTFSPEEIIDFAKRFDPLVFHTDSEAAQKSIFRGLIASGPHPFNFFHTQRWIPLFGKTVLCGLEVTSWKFLKPTYAGKEISCKVTIRDVRINREKMHAVVKWDYDIRNSKNELVQTLEMTVMHFIQ